MKLNIDSLITHSPPSSVIAGHCPPLNRAYWHLPLDWENVSSDRIEELWNGLGNPQMYCGHMHRSVIANKCRILDINEVYTLPPKGE
jgi:Icc-related predicted phosphoesterase